MTMMMSDSQRQMLRTYGTLVGRVLLGLLFLVTGFGMLMGGAPVGMIEGMGIPAAGLVAWIVVAMKLFGGASLVLGYRVGLGAALLFVFTLLTVVLIHINDETPTTLYKNLAIMGGLLYVMAYGPGDGWKLSK
jgi:putative oxidoreductase